MVGHHERMRHEQTEDRENGLPGSTPCGGCVYYSHGWDRGFARVTGDGEEMYKVHELRDGMMFIFISLQNASRHVV